MGAANSQSRSGSRSLADYLYYVSACLKIRKEKSNIGYRVELVVTCAAATGFLILPVHLFNSDLSWQTTSARKSNRDGLFTWMSLGAITGSDLHLPESGTSQPTPHVTALSTSASTA